MTHMKNGEWSNTASQDVCEYYHVHIPYNSAIFDN
jgi:hypothetical protein